MRENKPRLDKIGLKFSWGKYSQLKINLVTFPRLFFYPDKVYENLESVRSYSDK